MTSINAQEAWEAYRASELARALPVLGGLEFALDEAQVHIGGERYLMAGTRDVGGGGKKLVLIGTHTPSGARVIIKVSSDLAGKREIEREYIARTLINDLGFAHYTFHTPKHVVHQSYDDLLVSISEFIEQDRSFLTRNLEERFFLALSAFEAQEGVHATTYTHAKEIKDAFGFASADDYLREFETYHDEAIHNDPDNKDMVNALDRALTFLNENRLTIERYNGFLTHADFVPNNFRVRGQELFLLDYASLHFGNKYEGWARFLNFMIHHDPELEQRLVKHIRTHRSEEEYLSLRLMRVYKLGFLIKFWTAGLKEASGSLKELIRERIILWTRALDSVLNDTPVPSDVITHYLERQKDLRSEEEKARQREMLGR